MDRPNTIAKISIGTNAGVGTFSWMPTNEEPQPHWKIATTTPYPAPTDKRFNAAAFVAMTIDRNATVSKMNARRTTVRISHDMRCEILAVKSM
jgi:hypothetical protein